MLDSPSPVPGAKRIKMRYGPYQVPNMNKTGLVGEPGSLWLVLFRCQVNLYHTHNHPGTIRTLQFQSTIIPSYTGPYSDFIDHAQNAPSFPSEMA